MILYLNLAGHVMMRDYIVLPSVCYCVLFLTFVWENSREGDAMAVGKANVSADCWGLFQDDAILPV